MKSAPLSKDLERLLLSAPSLEPILTSYLLTQSRALNCLNNIMLIFDSQGTLPTIFSRHPDVGSKNLTRDNECIRYNYFI